MILCYLLNIDIFQSLFSKLCINSVQQQQQHTVGENIIATIKMRNDFCYPLKMVTFLYCSPFSYRSSNFAIAKVVALNLFASIFV